ncbi:glycosyl transferase family protein [Pseudaestuariivita atlantica]|uniref:Glycosyl transferase family 3 n=1 Tax=Pseudaestuariivita atlantica TaxID=1317121 RepID=A0A0L1JRM2_9RHOB|nr:glycosyl transferase family protein [Pseudaestuariivita atlantica]KNG94405.1 glycosyl transferase family 3 [Pseudaestuariivita atlantica]
MPESATRPSDLAPYVRILGRGPGRSRALTQDEARAAMALILEGEVAPEAVGALLMLMRFRGESAAEVAGCVDAVAATLDPAWADLPVALDWPSYAAGRSRGAPLFLLAARLVAAAGHPVLLHGWNSHQNPAADVRRALPGLDIPVVQTSADAATALEQGGIAYAPIEAIAPRAFDILRLRDVLGLRSCINTVLRMLNPAGAATSVQGVFHPPYRDLQADAGRLLMRHRITVIKGGGGEFERHPSKTVQAFGLSGGEVFETPAPALWDETRRLHEAEDATPPLPELWSGAARHDFAEAVIIGTAGLALWSLGQAATPVEGDALARRMWEARA